MPPARRVAVVFDPDQLDLRRRETVRGIARYAEAAGHWQWVLDPYALHHQPGAYDGILTPTGFRLAALFRRNDAPLVCVTWGYPDMPLSRAVENRYAAGRLAARHLVERGYRSFAYLGFARERQSCAERVSFRRELELLGRHMAATRTFVNYAQSATWYGQLMSALDEWLDRLARPVGIFICRPGLARTFAGIVLRKGLRIPEDVGLIAADNDPVLCEPAPALTSIHVDYAEVGYRAAALLDRLIDGQRPPAKGILIPPTLVPRVSTDRASLADPLIAKALWFIDSRRAEPIGPRHVADAVGLSLRALEQRVQTTRGRTVVQEIIRARVEHAKLYLADTRDPLGVIARESGLGSVESLRRAFRRHVGMPPGAWRRQAQAHRRGAENAEEHRKRPSRAKRTTIDP